MTKATHTGQRTLPGKPYKDRLPSGGIIWKDRPNVTVNVTLEADLEEILDQLAKRAAHSKRRMATAMRGAIIVRARELKST